MNFLIIIAAFLLAIVLVVLYWLTAGRDDQGELIIQPWDDME